MRACNCSQYGLLFVPSVGGKKDSPQMLNFSLYVVAFFPTLPRIVLIDNTVTTHNPDLISHVNLCLDCILSFLKLNSIGKISQILVFVFVCFASRITSTFIVLLKMIGKAKGQILCRGENPLYRKHALYLKGLTGLLKF